jgi:pimeloyl-ACP methyl ester carboxylesterase
MYLRAEGAGPPVFFIHGSATDHATWTIQLASLRERMRCVTWDRRGTGRSALPEPGAPLSVEAHADDAAAVLRTQADGKPRVVVGQSFGAVVALDLLRRYPEQVLGAVLMEPPLAATDDAPPIPEGFLHQYDARVREEGGPRAAEFFLRTVLGDAEWERIPRGFQDRSCALWGPIREDIAALGAYPVRYRALGEVRTPVLLLGGERSAPYYRTTLDALQAALPDARREELAGAGHMMHADVFRRFNARLCAFLEERGELQSGASSGAGT